MDLEGDSFVKLLIRGEFSFRSTSRVESRDQPGDVHLSTDASARVFLIPTGKQPSLGTKREGVVE